MNKNSDKKNSLDKTGEVNVVLTHWSLEISFNCDAKKSCVNLTSAFENYSEFF